MLKKALGTAAMGVLALTGTALADIDINIYGASAQHLFWNDAADNFLTQQGCTGVAQSSVDSKNGITRADCTATYGDYVNIRYTSKASWDGIYAAHNFSAAAVTPNPAPAFGNCAPGTNGVPADRYDYRAMADSLNATTTSCQKVHLGASDMKAPFFTQKSYGQKYGHLKGGWIEQEFFGIQNTTAPYEPLAVPFGFFANNNLGIYRCTNAGVMEGAMCSQNSECDTYSDVAGVKTSNNDGVCGAKTALDSISRQMAVALFSGDIYYWDDLGAGFDVDGNPATSDAVTVCFRHAGSGTHATLDWAVMQGNASRKIPWGKTLATEEMSAQTMGIQDEWYGATAEFPRFFFNDGSSDMMKCIRDNNGAIGYADADQLEASPAYATSVYALNYNGEKPDRYNIRNGVYTFWSLNRLYKNADITATQDTIITDLIAFAENPANIPSSKMAFWATSGEMKRAKAEPNVYPEVTGQAYPQRP